MVALKREMPWPRSWPVKSTLRVNCPFTFPPVRLEDNAAIALEAYPGNGKDVEYKEGIFVGYRWHDRQKIEPLSVSDTG